MNSLVLLLIAVAILLCGYVLYGRWLCKQWGVGENNEATPAHTMEDGVDYVPAKAPVLMGHHFSSIAGAGPITGPIQAAVFGWLPCVLWILVGGIFFGGVHDFGALFASVRHGGKSIGEIISANMSKRAKRLFIIFAYLTLILVVAAFASIVAGTFGANSVKEATEITAYAKVGDAYVSTENVADASVLETATIATSEDGKKFVADAEGNAIEGAAIIDGAVEIDGKVYPKGASQIEGEATVYAAAVEKNEVGTVLAKGAGTNASVAMVSILFIVIAIAFGFLVYRRNAPMGVATVAGVIAICLCMFIGMKWHPLYLSTNAWMWIVGAYITIASITPVWILLQPRDYLSSFLLYAMLLVAAVGVIVAHPQMSVVAEDGKTVGLQMFNPDKVGTIFPVLFTTIACGAISGFHSLVSSGTTSKQLDKETDAKPIAYGGMLLECVLAVITLAAIAYARQTGHTAGATDIFAGGVAGMAAQLAGGNETVFKTLYTLLVLTYSAFCLTSLDTATRLARFMFQEFWLDGSKGETPKNVTGVKKLLTNPLFATLLTVVLGIVLGMNGYSQIWALFGSANQLLAGLGLLAVATWLGNAGKNNKMFLFPMGFMLIVTIASLVINCIDKFKAIQGGAAALAALKLEAWGAWAQVIIGALLVVLAIVLAIEGVQTLSKKKAKV